MTSTTTEVGIARTFASEDGVVLELRGFETIDTNRYFETSLISQFAHEQELLFFWANLQISQLTVMDPNEERFFQFDMAPLLLYEAIVSGSGKLTNKKSVEQKLAEYLTINNAVTDEQDDSMDDQKVDSRNAAEEYGYVVCTDVVFRFCRISNIFGKS